MPTGKAFLRRAMGVLLLTLVGEHAAWAQGLDVQDRLPAQQARGHALPLQAGDYVRGILQGRGMRLVLLDASGQRQRVLARGVHEEQGFMFAAERGGAYTLQVRAAQAGSYRLQVDAPIPAQAAVPQAQAPAPESPRLRAWMTGPQPEHSAPFWQAVQAEGAPLVECEGLQPALAAGECLVTFVWRGAQRNVRLMGGPSNDHDALQRLGQTDIWYRSYRVPTSTRLSYQLAPDVPELPTLSPTERRRAILATAQRDPLNPRSFPAQPLDRFNAASLLELPQAPASPWLAVRPGVPRGALQVHRLASQHLGNERDIHLYRSAGYRSDDPQRTLLVLFDADRYLDEVPVPTLLDNLVADGKLAPVAAVFIANPSGRTRAAELPPNPAMAAFVAQELMPWAARQGLSAAPRRTVIAGASYGGLAAAWVALQHPEWFGRVLSQSGSFWWAPATAGEEPEWLTRQVAQQPVRPVRMLLEAGLFESGRAGQAGILETNRHLRDVLWAKGYSVLHREHAAGHDNAHWRVRFAPALLDLLQDEVGQKP